MYNTILPFYFMYFHWEDFNLFNFKTEIISIFTNKNPKYLYKYDFHLDCVYYIHLFESNNNKIICKLPFKLFSLNDNEDIIEDYYNKLLPSIDTYFSKRSDYKYPSYVGLYISRYNEEIINPKKLLEHK